MRILFDASGNWTPDGLLGGSEECVVMAAQALAARGHDVIVTNDAAVHQPFGAVWYNVNSVLPPDLVIVQRDWRKAVNARLRYPLARIALYCHDIPVDPHWPQGEAERALLLASVDRVVLLNDYHRRIYREAGLTQEKALVIRIGVNLADFGAAEAEGVERIPGRVIAIYHPNRGLVKLREAWPEVRRRVPHATLAAFWWEPQFFHDPVPEIGILPMRALKPADVPREILTADVFAYPSVFGAEISPASCIKAQAGGAYPVVVMAGGMNDVIDFGVAAQHNGFAEVLSDALLCRAEVKDERRRRMMAWARETFSWEAAAIEFESLAA